MFFSFVLFFFSFQFKELVAIETQLGGPYHKWTEEVAS